MPHKNGQTSVRVSSRRKLLRERFSRFLGEPNPKSGVCRPARDEVPLWANSGNECFVHYGPEGSNTGEESPLSSVQRVVKEVSNRLRWNGWQAYVVGGTLRDLISDPTKAGSHLILPRDIDIIVVNASLSELETCFADLVARRTRFGGLHLVKHLAGICEVHIDIWPLAETWAFRQYSIIADISRFPDTPFFNLDAAAIELNPGLGRQRVIYEHGFFEGMIAKTIDINFEPNPFPDLCVIRALIMAAKLQFALTRRLASFILARVTGEADAFARLRRAQTSHYGQIRCPDQELDSWFTSIRGQMNAGADLIEVRVSKVREIGLWQDHPPLQGIPLTQLDGPDITGPRVPTAN